MISNCLGGCGLSALPKLMLEFNFLCNCMKRYDLWEMIRQWRTHAEGCKWLLRIRMGQKSTGNGQIPETWPTNISHEETENLNRPIAGIETETRIQNFLKKLVGCNMAAVPAFWSPVVSDKWRQSWNPNKRKIEDKMALHIRIYQIFEGELMLNAFKLFQILKGNHPKLISWGPTALTPTPKLPQKRVSLMNSNEHWLITLMNTDVKILTDTPANGLRHHIQRILLHN